MVGRWSKLREPLLCGWRMSGDDAVDSEPPPAGVLPANCGNSMEPDTLEFWKEQCVSSASMAGPPSVKD